MGLGALGTHHREVAAKLKGRVTDKEAWIGSGEKGLQARSLQEVTREAWERGRLGRTLLGNPKGMVRCTRTISSFSALRSRERAESES